MSILVLIVGYLLVAGFCATFIWSWCKIKLHPNFDYWGTSAYKTVWLTMSSIIWPLWVLFPVFLLVKFLVTKLVGFWTYLIKETEDPRRNV